MTPVESQPVELARVESLPVELAAVQLQSPDALFPAGKPAWRAYCRKQARARPAAVRKTHEERAAREIAALVQAQGIETVGLYSALGAEPATRELANRLLVAGVRLAYPRMRADGVTMDLCQSDGPSALAARPRSRLLEPVGAIVPPADIGLIVVPAMALDAVLCRLGRGGGSFDRYLPLLPAETPRIGLVPAACIVPWEPCAAHDARLHAVCTEHGFFGPQTA